MKDEATTFIATCAGDPSVGLQGQQAEIKVYVEPEDIEFVKEQLAEAFSAIWDDTAQVYTEEEVRDGLDQENEDEEEENEDADYDD